MKKNVWDKILKVVIAVASAILGALGANAINRQRAFPVWRSILLQGIHPVFPYRPQRVGKRLPEESYRESLMSLNSTSLLTIA